MKILITGGSGFIGTNLLSLLVKVGHEVLNIDLTAPKLDSQLQYWRKCDIRNYKSLKEILEKFSPEYIIHLAADLGMQDAPLSAFDTNTIGVKNLVAITNEIQSVHRILYTSSLLVCRNGYLPSSNKDYCPPNTYGESKVIGEEIVTMNSAKANWVIVRPTSVWGPWFNYSYRKFFKLVDRGYYFQPGRFSPIKPICFVGNTCHMIHQLLLSNDYDVNSKIFYLADYPPCTTKDWADTIRRVLGKRGSSRIIPVIILRFAAILGDSLRLWGVQDPVFSSFRLKNMLTGANYPTEELSRIVGNLPYSLEDGVKQTLHWMRQQGDIK